MPGHYRCTTTPKGETEQREYRTSVRVRATLADVDFQGTLFDSQVRVGPERLDGIQRTPLSRGAWVDVRRNWFAGADEVFRSLVRDAPWRAERRQMYDRVVDVPRLVAMYGVGEALPHPALESAREALSRPLLPRVG